MASTSRHTHHASALSQSFPRHATATRGASSIASPSHAAARHRRLLEEPLPPPPLLETTQPAPRGGDPGSLSLAHSDAMSQSRHRGRAREPEPGAATSDGLSRRSTRARGRDRDRGRDTLTSTRLSDREGGAATTTTTLTSTTRRTTRRYGYDEVVVDGEEDPDETVLARSARTLQAEGTAVGAITQLTEIQRLLEDRMQAAERTSRALSSAQDTVNVEGMLTAAQLEAERWAMTHKGIPASLSGQEVHAVVAERNNLRLQLRKVAAEIQKVELAGGGKSLEVVRQCQADMEQLARLKSQIELDHDQLVIRMRMTESELESLKDQHSQLELHVGTSDGQLQERNQALLLLRQQVADLQRKLRTNEALGKESLLKTLDEERTRLRADLERERTAAIERTEAAMRQEQFQALEALRADLEKKASDLLNAKLSEQREALLQQAAVDKAAEMQAFQQKVHNEHTADVEQLRHAAARDKAAAIQSMERKHLNNQERLTQEIERLHRETQAKMDREAEELRKTLQNDAIYERRAALDKFESNLKAKHARELEELRETLNRRHEQNLQSTVQRRLDAQQKALRAQFNRERLTSTEALKHDMQREFTLKQQELQSNLTKSLEAAFERRLAKALEDERKRLLREGQRDKAATIEKITADFRATKVKEVKRARASVTAMHAAERDKLVDQTAKMQVELSTLKGKTHIEASHEVEAAAKLKRSRIALREFLRNLQNSMKLALTPRFDVHVDTTPSSASTGIASLASMIKDLNKSPPDFSLQDEPSLPATGAPDVTFDVLSRCVEELCAHLNTANQHIEDFQIALDRERKYVRKVVEEEIADERQAELEMLRAGMIKQQEHDLDRRLEELHLTHNQELARERKAMEDRVKAVERQSAARQQEQALHLSQRLDKERTLNAGQTGASMRKDRYWEQEYLAAKRDMKKLQGRLKRQGQELIDLRKANSALATKSGAPGLGKTGGGGTASAASLAEIKRLKQELGLQELERIRLEKLVANLRDHLTS